MLSLRCLNPESSTSVGHSLFKPAHPCSLSFTLSHLLNLSIAASEILPFPPSLLAPFALYCRDPSERGSGDSSRPPSPAPQRPQQHPVIATAITRHGFDAIRQFPREFTAQLTLNSSNPFRIPGIRAQPPSLTSLGYHRTSVATRFCLSATYVNASPVSNFQFLRSQSLSQSRSRN